MIITSGTYKGQKIAVPSENITRPTLSKVRMSVFNTLQSLIEFNNKSFFDMFAGSGIMGLEALSRGFATVTAIEKHPKAAQILKANYNKIGQVAKINFIQGDSLKISPKLNDKFDVIYIDPPYYAGIYEESLQAIKSLTKGIIILEHANEVDCSGFELIKQKKYGDKFISFLEVN